MPSRRGSLNVYKTGKLTVVSFVSADLLDQIVVSECREGLPRSFASIIAKFWPSI